MNEQAYWNQMYANAMDESIRINSPFGRLRPRMFPDGDKWCALYGDNLQDGVCAFGGTPAEAERNFDINWINQKAVKLSREPKT